MPESLKLGLASSLNRECLRREQPILFREEALFRAGFTNGSKTIDFGEHELLLAANFQCRALGVQPRFAEISSWTVQLGT